MEIVHQTWKDQNLSGDMQESQDAWKKWAEKHGWTYKFWTDQDNEKLVEAYEDGDLNDMAKSFPLGIQRSLVARYLYMFNEGGLYVDLDVLPTDATLPMLQTFQKYEYVFVDRELPHGGKVLSTSWLYSRNVNANFWKELLDKLATDAGKSIWSNVFKHYEVYGRTGCYLLDQEWKAYEGSKKQGTDQGLVIDPHLFENHMAHKNKSKQKSAWRDWDSNVAESMQSAWYYRNWVLAILCLVLVISLICVVSLR